MALEVNNQKLAKRILLLTGLIPLLSSWIWYFWQLNANKDEVLFMVICFVVSLVLLSLASWVFRRRYFDWIYLQRPVVGSFVSVVVHMLAGYFSVLLPLLIKSIIQTFPIKWESMMSLFFYGLLILWVQIPGAIISFYINAHLFVRLSKGKWIVSN